MPWLIIVSLLAAVAVTLFDPALGVMNTTPLTPPSELLPSYHDDNKGLNLRRNVRGFNALAGKTILSRVDVLSPREGRGLALGSNSFNSFPSVLVFEKEITAVESSKGNGLVGIGFERTFWVITLLAKSRNIGMKMSKITESIEKIAVDEYKSVYSRVVAQKTSAVYPIFLAINTQLAVYIFSNYLKTINFLLPAERFLNGLCGISATICTIVSIVIFLIEFSPFGDERILLYSLEELYAKHQKRARQTPFEGFIETFLPAIFRDSASSEDDEITLEKTRLGVISEITKESASLRKLISKQAYRVTLCMFLIFVSDGFLGMIGMSILNHSAGQNHRAQPLDTRRFDFYKNPSNQFGILTQKI